MSNVITFPKGRKDAPPQSLEETLDIVQKLRQDTLHATVNVLATNVMIMLGEAGIDVMEEKYMQDSALLIESLTSLVSRSLDLKHALQDFAETCFTMDYNEDSDSIDYKYIIPNNEESED
jgi:hypothetical protein